MIKNNKAFSLIELLVVVVMIGLISIIGIRAYNKQKQQSWTAWTKSEMTNISRLMNMAQSTDRGFHQYIYAMGYQPSGKTFAAIGTAADPDTICCGKYPALGTDPCSKYGGGFTYYNCKDTAIDKATDNIEICTGTGYDDSCTDRSGTKITTANANSLNLGILGSTSLSTCTPDPATWCDCNTFTIGAKTFFGREMSLNHEGTVCQHDP